MSNESSAPVTAKSRPSAQFTPDWSAASLEADIGASFMFAKHSGGKGSLPTSTTPAGPPRPPAKQPSNLAFASQSSSRQPLPFGNSSASNQPQQSRRQQPSGAGPSASTDVSDPARTSSVSQPAIQQPSSSVPSHGQASSQPWAPGPSQLFRHGAPGGQPDLTSLPHSPSPLQRTAAGSASTAHIASAPDRSGRPKTARPVQQQQHHQHDDGSADERRGRPTAPTASRPAPTSGPDKRPAPTTATDADDDEGLGSSFGSSTKGKGRAEATSSHRSTGFGAYANQPTSLEPRTTTRPSDLTTAAPSEPSKEPKAQTTADFFGETNSAPNSDESAPGPASTHKSTQPRVDDSAPVKPTAASSSRPSAPKSSSRPAATASAPKQPAPRPISKVYPAHGSGSSQQEGEVSRHFAHPDHDTALEPIPAAASTTTPAAVPQAQTPAALGSALERESDRNDHADEDARKTATTSAERSRSAGPAGERRSTATSGDAGRRRTTESGTRPSGTSTGSRRPSTETSRGTGGGGGSQVRRKRPRAEDESDDKNTKRAKIGSLLDELNADADKKEEENLRLKEQIATFDQKQKDMESRLAQQKEVASKYLSMHADMARSLAEMQDARKHADLQKHSVTREVASYKRMIKDEGITRETAFNSATATLTKLRADKDEAVDQLQNYQVDARARAEGAEQSLSILKTDLSNKVGELAERSNRIASLEETIDKKDGDLRVLNGLIQSMTDQHRTELEKLHALLQTAQASALANDQKIASIETALAASKSEFEDVQRRLGTANDAEMPALRQELQDRQKDLVQKDALVTTLQRDMDAQTKALESASKRTEDLQQELASTQTRLSEVEQELSASKQAIQRENDIRAETKKALDESTEAHAQTREKLAETRAKLEERDQQLKLTTEQIKDLQQEKTRLEKREADQQRLRAHRSSSDHPDASEDLANLERQVTRLEGEKDEVIQKLLVSEREASREQAEKVKLAAEVESLQFVKTEKTALEDKLAAAQEEVDQLKKAHDPIREELAQKTAECAAEKENAEKSKAKLMTLQKELIELEKKRSTLVARFRRKDGKGPGLDPEESKLIAEVHASFKDSQNKEKAKQANEAKQHEGAIKKLQAEVQTLRTKIAKVGSGKSGRDLIGDPETFDQSSSPVSGENDDPSSDHLEENSSPGSPSVAVASTQNAGSGTRRTPGLMGPPEKIRAIPLEDDDEAAEGPLPPQSSSSMSSVEEETQAVAVSPARTNASGVVVQRGQADAAAAAASKKRTAATAVGEQQQQLGGRSSMPGSSGASGPPPAKKTRTGSIGATAAAKSQSQGQSQRPTTRQTQQGPR